MILHKRVKRDLKLPLLSGTSSSDLRTGSKRCLLTHASVRQHGAELARNRFQISYIKLDLATARELLPEFLGRKIIFKTDFQRI